MKYIKLYEAFDKDLICDKIDSFINHNLINNLCDMALEYIDDGFMLSLSILSIDGLNLYYMNFSHDENYIRTIRDMYEDYDNRRISLNEISISGIKYFIYLYKEREESIDLLSGEAITKELISRLGEAYPDVNIIIPRYDKLKK